MTEKLNDKALGFFLTEKMSLKNWDKAGILSREIAPYNILAKYFQKKTPPPPDFSQEA